MKSFEQWTRDLARELHKSHQEIDISTYSPVSNRDDIDIGDYVRIAPWAVVYYGDQAHEGDQGIVTGIVNLRYSSYEFVVDVEWTSSGLMSMYRLEDLLKKA